MCRPDVRADQAALALRRHRGLTDRLVYRLLRWGHAYIDKGQQYYEERHREQQVQLLTKRAAKLGLQLVARETPAQLGAAFTDLVLRVQFGIVPTR